MAWRPREGAGAHSTLDHSPGPFHGTPIRYITSTSVEVAGSGPGEPPLLRPRPAQRYRAGCPARDRCTRRSAPGCAITLNERDASHPTVAGRLTQPASAHDSDSSAGPSRVSKRPMGSIAAVPARPGALPLPLLTGSAHQSPPTATPVRARYRW